MRSTHRCLLVALSVSVVPIAVAVAPVGSAECTNAGAATVCAQGDVRGGGPSATQAGPAYPGYCADPWYCSDDWGVDIILDPGPPRPPIIDRPGRPGIGPR
ncbi:hypothetical protein [Mycobacterium sp. 1164985.4]|uniref:hypothetical protein n=1 Tax=Mycobacterium sp. 1164985.4 TaxID=1834069 RepID=UPI0009EE3AED|nr:hypothetical protein [Mycobacterium sp. 1164985.4]